VALAAFGIAALPQSGSASEAIKIEADKVATITQGHYPNTTQSVQLSRTVSYADLDLSTSAGANEFQNRIQGTAEQVCDQLRTFAPAGSVVAEMNERATCVKDAVNAAMGKARVVVASAQKAKQG
jgi:UrcA family protein